MQLQFHLCTLDDLETLIKISRKTFIDAFEKDNNPSDFKAYMDMAFERENLRSQLKDVDCSFYFVFWEHQLGGYFKIIKNKSPNELSVSNAIQLERIYVLDGFQGNKIGKGILDKTLQLANQEKSKYVWLGVWQKNTHAIRFYEKNGFAKFATQPYYIGTDKQTDWLMRYELKKPLLENKRGL